MQPFRIFRITAIAEAFSWAGLLVGMYLKHVAEVTDAGVWLFGRLHGALFVAYLAATAWVSRAERWSMWRTVLALLASIPPLTTLIFERWVSARRRRETPSSGTPAGGVAGVGGPAGAEPRMVTPSARQPQG